MLGIGLCAIMFLLLNDLVDTMRLTLAIELPMKALRAGKCTLTTD